MRKIYLSLLSLLIVTEIYSQQIEPTVHWNRSKNGQTSTNDYVVKSVRDNFGNTYLLSDDNNDMVTIKFDNTGSILKTYHFNNTYNGGDRPSDLMVDQNQNVYMAGESFDDYIWKPSLVKFDAAGNIIYSYLFNAVFYTDSKIRAITLDDNDNILFTGSNSDSIFVGKVDATGNIIWQFTYAPIGYSIGTGNDIQVDDNGNAFITGQIMNAAGNYDIITFRVSNTGTVTWTKYIAGTAIGDDIGLKINLDQSSNSYVYYEISEISTTNQTIGIAKYNASGGSQWNNMYFQTGQTDANLADAVIDPVGNSFIAMNIKTATDNYIFTQKISSLGAFQWSQTFNDAGSSQEFATGVNFDANGYCYTLWYDSGITKEAIIQKTDGNGTTVWQRTYNNFTGDNEHSASIHIDNGSNIYLSCTAGSTNSNAILAKYNTNGNFNFESVYDAVGNPSDQAVEIFTNANNSIYALGTIQNQSTYSDVLISKLDAQGNVLWENVIDNLQNTDIAFDMTHDTNFDIYMLSGDAVQESYLYKFDSIGSQVYTVNLAKQYKKIHIASAELFIAGNDKSINTNDFIVAKYTAIGGNIYQSTPSAVALNSTEIKDMAVDNNGRIYPFGEVYIDQNNGSGLFKKKLKVQKYSTIGNLVWEYEIPNLDSTTFNPYTTEAKKVIVDAANNVYLLGHSRNSNYTHDFSFILKLDNNGNLLWRFEFNNSDTDHEYAADMVTSSASTLLTYTYGNQGIILRRIDRTTGSVVGDEVYSEPGISMQGGDMHEDNNGFVYIAGTAFSTVSLRDILLLKYSALGNLEWKSRVSGDYTGDDYPVMLDVTANNRIYLTASTVMESGNETDFSVIKFCDMAPDSILITDNTNNICPEDIVQMSISPLQNYIWSTGESTSSISATDPGNYWCTITKSDGCYKVSDTISISIKPLPSAPEICMVTVDSLGTHNIIYWDKTNITGASGFNIYREDVTNFYTLIGTVSIDSLSEYHDYQANPNVTSKRYKISAIDSCGQESALSKYHNTLFIVDIGGGQYTWNPLYTIENSPNPVDNYILMRDDNSSGNWAQVAITAGTQNVLSDTDYQLFPNADWRVETIWNINCEPTRAGVNTSRSNIKNQSIANGFLEINENSIQVYPNPSNGIIQLDFPVHLSIESVELFDAVGKSILVTYSDFKKLDISNLNPGIYYLKLNTNQGIFNKSLVLQ